MEYKNFSFEVKAEGEENILVGYASTWDLDKHGDVIAKGAYVSSMEKIKAGEVPLVSSHSLDGRDVLGTVVDAMEDEKGLFIKAKISSAPSAQDVFMKVKEGHITKMSVGFMAGEVGYEKREGKSVRIIKEADLIEISVVPVPANDEARILLAKELLDAATEASINYTDKKEKHGMSEEMKKEHEAETEAKDFAELETLKERLAALEAKEAEMSKPVRMNKFDDIEEKTEMKENTYTDAVHKYIRGEMSLREVKSLSSNIDAQGGVLLPEELSNDIMSRLRDEVNMMNLASVIRTNAASMAMPQFDFDGTVPHRAEAGAYTTETIDGFGKVRLVPESRGIVLKLPEELLEDAPQDLFRFIADHYAMRLGEILEDLFLNGTGSSQPQGLVTAINDLGSGSANIVTNSSVSYDKLVETMMKLKAQYRRGAAWILSRDVLEDIHQLEDGLNFRIFDGPRQNGTLATLFGFPVYETEFFTRSSGMGSPQSGESLALFGNFKRAYIIAQRKDIEIRRLDERYADNGYVGLRVGIRVDGGILDKNAVSLFKVT